MIEVAYYLIRSHEPDSGTSIGHDTTLAATIREIEIQQQSDHVRVTFPSDAMLTGSPAQVLPVLRAMTPGASDE